MAVQYPRLRDLREDYDLTQKQVAEHLNIKPQQYSRYETGTNDIPTRILIGLASLFNTSIDYLLGMTNNPKPYTDIDK